MSKPTLTERLKTLLPAYGKIALIVYFVLYAAVYLGFLVSISTGIGDTDAAGTLSTAGAAWLATKLTQPFRIGATFLLTPIIARVFRRRPSAAESNSVESATSSAADAAASVND